MFRDATDATDLIQNGFKSGLALIAMRMVGWRGKKKGVGGGFFCHPCIC
jgi:hypothetical protein